MTVGALLVVSVAQAMVWAGSHFDGTERLYGLGVLQPDPVAFQLSVRPEFALIPPTPQTPLTVTELEP